MKRQNSIKRYVITAYVAFTVCFFLSSVSSAMPVLPSGNSVLYDWPLSNPYQIWAQDGEFTEWLTPTYSINVESSNPLPWRNSSFLGGNGPDSFSNYHMYASNRISSAFILRNQEILRTTYLDPAKSSFSNISTKLSKLDQKVDNLQPQVITQSISFLLGAFVAIAFVVSASRRL
ncbi:hypothetical protein [Geobacter sp. SVR]|uniref:hypothetical protein n=1 Tax=Geobacter sp. SVR TaxID=2495594 RepID=UPI00156676FA|nr:hypothetical protein [Geobacter sp. SVR]